MFRNVVKSRFSVRELAEIGIDNVNEFSIQDYIVNHGLVGEAALADAVVREYIKFQYVSGIIAWADCVDQAKAVAKQQRRVMPCGGNQINAWGTWPYAVALSQFCDFVEIEELVGVKDEVRPRTLQYKLGLASGHHEKPVWVRGPVTDETKEKMPMLSTSYWTVHFAEGLANGGIREFSLGINKPWTGEPDTPDFLDDPGLYRLYVEFAEWMREHRSLLIERDSGARVAVVYSLPTLMFRRYDALRTQDDGRLGAFEAATQLLEKQHVPYDVVVFGHPEIWDDAKTFARIRSHYDVIILPGVDALSDGQIKFLGERAEAGTVLLAGQAFERDENLNPRSRDAKQPETKPLTEENVVRHGREANPLVEIDAPEHVSVNVWRSCRGKSFDVHLLNYDADVARGRMKPVEDIELGVQLPAKLRLQRCLVSQFGAEDREIPFKKDGKWVKVKLDRLHGYAIVSFTDKNGIEIARRAAENRRRVDREMVKRIAQKYNLY